MNRRQFIEAGLKGAAACVAGAPAIVQRSRPTLPQGAAAGDVGGGRGVIWSRCDRSARMFVEYSTSESFSNLHRVAGPAALESTDHTARTVLTDLPPGQRIFYRVTFQDLGDLRTWSEPVTGSFQTPFGSARGRPPGTRDRRDVTLAWSADSVGQGWGINTEWGGLRLYDTMRRAEPDVFIHCGDTIYADQHVPPEITLDDGRIWKNVVTPAKSKVAETLDEYRGNYQYNLLDEHMRRFNVEVAQIVIWDDHEVRDNWYWERDLTTDERYAVKSAALLAARARQAFFEYNPLTLQADDPERIYRRVSLGPLADVFALDLRTYRNANAANRQSKLEDGARLLGAAQLDWLKTGLASSTAAWKIVACDMPIGVVVRDGPDAYEAIANADGGPPLGRELEIADLLRFLRAKRVRNVVWITGDIHYCAAHHYHPARARFTDFDPFWEFVAGPLNAGTFGPGALDPTFGPEARFNGVQKGMKQNRPPSDGLQFFGKIRIDGRTRALTVTLHDLSGRALYTVDLEHQR
jgi:alkaline phosphatase D